MAAVMTSGLVLVSPNLFSSVSLLRVSYTISKAINMKTRLMWKSEYRKKDHNIFVLIIFYYL